MKKSVSLAVAFLLLIGMIIYPSQSFAEESGEWVKKSDLPEDRAGAAIAEVNGNIYIIGGSSDGS